ncbi:Delta(24)-sterol C-methyltransferase [Venturia effusa]|uniref:Squalene synthase n=1 Tax=Venturia effusa TaxID=50376 RepID=A0A517KZN8_9PEZI|nr:Delta(24)-sterol C-methyltransferase [Venturia effusa]
MGKLDAIYYIFHPKELRSIIQWKVWHNPVHERDESKESESLRKCFYYLDKTSRSFAAVIKELHPELLVPICLFYLILRGLDTIEDDMTIALDEKDPILRKFDEILGQDGWNYSGNHSKEKDRDLLVEFNVVIEQFKQIKPEYQAIISDITKRMGNGMADYCANAEHNLNGVETIKDYELYCHHVAGLVGEGLTKLFVEAKLANPALLTRPELHESMGQFLQNVNIIRDIREDADEKRYFYPKEVWSKHAAKFSDLFDPAKKDKAMDCSSEMILNALQRAPDCLFYLAGLKDQSVFNFCAIPQAMAIATLDACYRNPDLFQKNVKITKGQACQLMIESTQNLQILCEVFRRHARSINKKSVGTDPSSFQISIACGKIEQFIESIFPSQKPGQAAAPMPARLTAAEAERREAEEKEAKWDMIYLTLAVMGFLTFLTLLMVGAAYLAGARWTPLIDAAKEYFAEPTAKAIPSPVPTGGHGEL